VLRQQSQKCASLAAIARYITIIYTIGYVQVFKAARCFCKEALAWSVTKPQIMTFFPN